MASRTNPLNAASSGNNVLPQSEPTQGQFSISKILVYDTICSVYKKTQYKEEVGEDAEPIEHNPPIGFSWEELRDAPRNSIVGYDVSEAGNIKMKNEGPDSDPTELKLYYPFFSSHFVLPVKPGEYVFAVNTSPGETVGYWMTRVPGNLMSEDVNYTHIDRRFISPGTSPDSEVGSKFRKPSFPNGSSILSLDPEKVLTEEEAAEEESFYIIDERTGYDKIWNNFLGSETTEGGFFPEAVPRITKRPGDFILQGSNNSAIILGSDRGYGITQRPAPEKSNAEAEGFADPLAGSIDIVVGRGRIFDLDSVIGGAPKDWENSLTRPRVIENTRFSTEVDKDPTTDEKNKSDASDKLSLDKDARQDLENRFVDIPEGDPDFINDAARVYVSMRGNIDDKLGISPSVIPKAVVGSLDEADDRSSASLKADRVRIVARNSVEGLPTYSDSDIADGDIRIVKQGSPGGTAASIYLLSDGTVQVSGKTINLTRQEDISASSYGASGPGPGGMQPYVRFSDLKKLFEETFTALEKMADTVLTHVTPGNGAPSPQLLKCADDLKADLAAIKSASKDFDEMASVRIFGE